MTEASPGDVKNETLVNLTEVQRRSLAKEATKAIVTAYAGAGAAPGEARAFFQKVGGDQAPKMTRALAELYRREGNVDAASALLEPVAPATMESGVR